MTEEEIERINRFLKEYHSDLAAFERDYEAWKKSPIGRLLAPPERPDDDDDDDWD